MNEAALIIGSIATVTMAWLAWEVRLLRKTYRPILLLFLFTPAATATAQPKKEPPKVERLPSSADAIELAWIDAQTLPTSDRPFMRWVWISEPTKERVKAYSLALNYASRASVPLRPQPLLNGVLLRIDLRKWAPQPTDLEQWIANWELLRFDPAFNLILTRDMFELVLGLPDATQPRARVRTSTGFDAVAFGSLNLKDVDAVRLIAPHLKLETAVKLQDACLSAAPVVEARYLFSRMLTTIQDKGLAETLYGGLYYEFAGISEAKNGTDEDLLFRNLGVGSDGESAEQVFSRLRSDQRVAVFRRNLNGKPSRVDFIPTLSRRGGDGVSFFAITHDVKDASIDVGQHPIMNLSQFKDDAREGIFTRANGMPGYVLFNGAGKLQRFVPPDVAADRGIPTPFQPILQGALSCIHCHEAGGSDGWQPVQNDVKTLLKEVDVFVDLSQRNKLQADTLDRLGGQYMGSPDKLLRRARDDYAETVLKITGPWKDGGDQTGVIKNASRELIDNIYAWKYGAVDAQTALRELGVSVPKNQAREYLKNLLPPDKDAAYLGLVPEDARVAALKAGLSISRSEWDLVRSFAAYRAKRTLDAMPTPKEMPK